MRHEVIITLTSDGEGDDIQFSVNLQEAFDEDVASHRMATAIVNFVTTVGDNIRDATLDGVPQGPLQ